MKQFSHFKDLDINLSFTIMNVSDTVDYSSQTRQYWIRYHLYYHRHTEK